MSLRLRPPGRGTETPSNRKYTPLMSRLLWKLFFPLSVSVFMCLQWLFLKSYLGHLSDIEGHSQVIYHKNGCLAPCLLSVSHGCHWIHFWMAVSAHLGRTVAKTDPDNGSHDNLFFSRFSLHGACLSLEIVRQLFSLVPSCSSLSGNQGPPQQRKRQTELVLVFMILTR